MSTSYYFEHNESKRQCDTFNAGLTKQIAVTEEHLQQLGLGYEDYKQVVDALFTLERQPRRLHIGKTSMGWKPLFEMQAEYRGITGMREWYKKNRAEWRIINEYDVELTWEELEERLIKYSHLNPTAKSNTIIGRSYRLEDGYEWSDSPFS